MNADLTARAASAAFSTSNSPASTPSRMIRTTMSSYNDALRARIADKRRRLERLKSGPRFVPIGRSINAADAGIHELERQIGAYEALLADHASREA
jgi:hypothetical protein